MEVLGGDFSIFSTPTGLFSALNNNTCHLTDPFDSITIHCGRALKIHVPVCAALSFLFYFFKRKLKQYFCMKFLLGRQYSYAGVHGLPYGVFSTSSCDNTFLTLQTEVKNSRYSCLLFEILFMVCQ